MQQNRGMNPPIPSNPPRVRHLSFQPAMEDFKKMFPEMDLDVIEEVLRANGGAVDVTIDQLLTMTTDNLNDALRLELDREEKNKNKTENSCTCIVDKTGGVKSNGTPSKASQKWVPPLLGPLPPTFLRIEPVNEKLFPGSEDESIALFLQNEEFLSELRTNEDFMSTLEEDGVEGGVAVSDIETFKKRLRNMGKKSRKKFYQLSRVFQRHKKNRSAKGILDQSACGDSRLLSGEPLLSENYDDSIHK